MPRLIAIEGPESGLALPILGLETFLAPGPDRQVELSRAGERPPNGAVVRRATSGAYRIERLSAAGGTAASPLFVNGEEVEVADLNHGDLITYGGATLIFDCDEVGETDTVIDAALAAQRRRQTPASRPAAAAPRPAPPRPPRPVASGDDEAPSAAQILAGESIRYRQKAYDDPSAAIAGAGAAARAATRPVAAEAGGVAPGRGTAERSPSDRLAVLLKVATAVGSTLDLGSLLARLLDLIFEEVPADRGTILLFDRPAKKLRSMISKRRAGRERGGETPSGGVRVSRTIIREALTSRESILTVDAMADERFKLGESVAAAGIRSAMCVPIVRSGRALGVIHLDTERASAVAEGGPMERSPGFSRADLGLLTGIASVVSLAIENARLFQEAAERERLRTELAVASAIQHRLVPKSPPRTADLDVFGRMIPAKELGGDLFDFIEDEERGTLHVLVGDVSGKGVGAGIVMAMARCYLRPLAGMFESTKDVLVRANRLLYEDTSRDLFMSAVLLRWDSRRRRLVYCGAGQEHILIVRAGSEQCEAIPAGGLALMMVEEAEEYLEEKELPLDPGDLILLYSDGVIDARDPAGRFFGLERLRSILPAMARLGSARAVVDRLTAEVRAFAGEADQHDDITVVALRRQSSAERPGASAA